MYVELLFGQPILGYFLIMNPHLPFHPSNEQGAKRLLSERPRTLKVRLREQEQRREARAQIISVQTMQRRLLRYLEWYIKQKQWYYLWVLETIVANGDITETRMCR